MSETPARYAGRGASDQPLIRNCRFAFRCHQNWSSLETTDDPSVRYCHECSRQVVLYRRDAELLAALRKDQCVAIERAATSGARHTVGVLVP